MKREDSILTIHEILVMTNISYLLAFQETTSMTLSILFHHQIFVILQIDQFVRVLDYTYASFDWVYPIDY